jgi:hypothetical protein
MFEMEKGRYRPFSFLPRAGIVILRLVLEERELKDLIGELIGKFVINKEVYFIVC